MVKLKISGLPNDKPVKVTVELPASVHGDQIAYGDILARETGQLIDDPSKLIVPMIKRIMERDRASITLGRDRPSARSQK